MRSIVNQIRGWQEQGHNQIAIATIVRTQGSSLRPSGTRMAINDQGAIAGSVSSGCVDSEVISEMERILAREELWLRPYYGISDELAWGAGLSCGGSIDVYVEPWSSMHDLLLQEVGADRVVGVAQRLDGQGCLLCLHDGEVVDSLGNQTLDRAVMSEISRHWPGPFNRIINLDDTQIFVEVIPPSPQLLIFGATDIAVSLSTMAQAIGYRVIVSDARRAFLTDERFPGADVRLGWPQNLFTPDTLGTGWTVVVLFHDVKLDIPALTLALRSHARYVGLLGSRKTQEERRSLLLKGGFTEVDLARIHGPAGLDIGGREPALIALSILAEIVAVRNQRDGCRINLDAERRGVI